MFAVGLGLFGLRKAMFFRTRANQGDRREIYKSVLLEVQKDFLHGGIFLRKKRLWQEEQRRVNKKFKNFSH